MKTINKILVSLLMVYFFSVESFAQTKFEREYRITRSEAPLTAVSFIDSCNFSGKIRWHAEESQDGKTFEAKTKHLNYRYSIEFDTNGVLQDIEKEVGFNELEKSVKDAATKALGDLFISYKVRKIQIQWSGKREILFELLKNGHSDQSYTTQYEIVVKARKEGFSSYFEVLLDASGNAVKILEIKQQSADNLMF
jgi:hypothetical protein